VVRTTVTLPKELWEELKIESVKTNKTLSEVLVKRLKECEELKKRLGLAEL